MNTKVRRTTRKLAINKGIGIDVIGESDPFSLLGKSTGYRILIKNTSYLFDMGAPVFQFLGPGGLSGVKGVFCTHSHEDHRRWFTDYVLYKFYNPNLREKVTLITTENLHEEFHKNSRGALERSLSLDSKRVVEVPYTDQVNQIIIGPKSKYYIKEVEFDANKGRVWRVLDREGNIVPAEKAKVFIHPQQTRPRMLFKDSTSGEWVEPDVFYPYSNTEFYEENQNDYIDEEIGLRVQAIKSSAWHGPFTVSMKFITEDSQVLFSSDTVYDEKLWHELTFTKHKMNLDGMSPEEFEKAPVIHGDINDFIERVWSKERYETALTAYDDCVIIHEVARPGSVVHTSYPNIAKSKHDNIIFTHMPDELVSTRPLLKTDMRLNIRDNVLYEEISEDNNFPFCADIYIKEYNSNFVGFKNSNGKTAVCEGPDGMLYLSPGSRKGDPGFLMRVDLYQDVGGHYLYRLDDPNEEYTIRYDGKIEKVTYTEYGSSGKIVPSLREVLTEKYCEVK